MSTKLLIHAKHGWKKLDAKDHILYDFIYMKYPEKGNYGDEIQIHGCLRLEEGEMGVIAIVYEISLWWWKYSKVGLCWGLYNFVNKYIKKHGTVHFKWLGFMVCKLYLNKTVKSNTI